MASSAVLDSSAVLAVFFNETGNEAVIPVLQGALLSTVNVVEIHSRMIDRGVPAERSWNWLMSIQCEICPFSAEQARRAAELRTLTRPLGLSLGDRACLALAIDRKAPVYTTDRAWKNLPLEVQIEVIR